MSDKVKPEAPGLKVKSEIYDRLHEISETTGMDLNILAGHILNDGLERIENGGGFNINVQDGSIKYNGPPLPVSRPQAVSRPEPQLKTDPDTGAKYREVDLSGVK